MITRLNPELLALAVPFVLLTLDAIRRYLKDEEVKMHQLPWLEFRALFEYGRKALFTIDRPDHPSFVVDYSAEHVRKELGKQGVKFNHPFSYVYEGEILNGVFYYYDPDRTLPHRQIHVRAFDGGESLELMCHEEPCWYAHPVAHLKSDNMEYEMANEWAKMRLYEHIPVGYPSD